MQYLTSHTLCHGHRNCADTSGCKHRPIYNKCDIIIIITIIITIIIIRSQQLAIFNIPRQTQPTTQPSQCIHPRNRGRCPLDELNLPYRSLTSEANTQAYTTERSETPSGNILCEVSIEQDRPDRTLRTRHSSHLLWAIDPEKPKNWTKAYLQVVVQGARWSWLRRASSQRLSTAPSSRPIGSAQQRSSE